MKNTTKERRVRSEVMLSRMQRLTGEAVMRRLEKTSVAVFGVGGVGSWCAEALVRSGVGMITIVDSDLICATNINRQVQATSTTVGRVKVDELARRLCEIYPAARIIARQEIYKHETADSFDLGSFDYVIDAIDSLSAKVDLIMSATAAGATVFTSLGASCKVDPSKIRVASLWKSQGCHLGKLVRKRLRRRKFDGDPLCVYSEELLEPHPVSEGCGSGTCVCPKSVTGTPDDEETMAHEWCSMKKQINGSAVHITGSFGFYLAGLVIQDVMRTVDMPPQGAVGA